MGFLKSIFVTLNSLMKSSLGRAWSQLGTIHKRLWQFVGFLTLPSSAVFYSTIRCQFWPIFDPSPPLPIANTFYGGPLMEEYWNITKNLRGGFNIDISFVVSSVLNSSFFIFVWPKPWLIKGHTPLKNKLLCQLFMALR